MDIMREIKKITNITYQGPYSLNSTSSSYSKTVFTSKTMVFPNDRISQFGLPVKDSSEEVKTVTSEPNVKR